MPAPTNRPFFSNFLAAFRAHQSLHHTVKSASSTALTGTTTTSSTHGASTLRTTPSEPQRTIVTTTKPTQPQQSSTTASAQGAAAASKAIHPTFSPRHHSVSPYSRSPGNVSPGSPPFQRGRRGSDSSNEGFRDVVGEKWYIGGRTAGGEERFYKLGLVRRRSVDGVSL